MAMHRQEKDYYKLVNLIRQREIQESIAHMVSQKLHVTENLILRLGLEKELNGHSGCVNCLEWDETGKILASASDDTNIILWDPFRYEKKVVIQTGHRGNIFSVKFMPKTNNNVLVSGAADCKVRVHDLSLTEPILACNCHLGRVKRIATIGSIPSLFWSVAEDGLVLQYDIRAPHTCENTEPNVLINLVNHMGKSAEGKCISINPKRPELVAVGANDAYIRMYDRRMIKLSQLPIVDWGRRHFDFIRAGAGDLEDNVPLGCAQYFIAGHLHSRSRDGNRSLTATYLTFSADGNELLVNMGGEQIYLYDINNTKNSKIFQSYNIKNILETNENDSKSKNGCIEGYDVNFASKNIRTLPHHVEDLKRQANEGFEQQKYTIAINLYNKAISYCPTAAVLFANRAAAFMKRAWDGDTYAALRDCRTTLLFDPQHVKAHFRLARCLFDLNRSVEAEKVIKNFLYKFPEYASNSACKALKMDIKEAIDSGRDIDSFEQELSRISGYEKEWRSNTIDYKMRFCGHCNTTTDIKEANFFGNNGQYIVAGSDDGSFFIWDRNTTNIVRVLRGDDRIVNCLQPHPSTCLLATSGIDPVIRLWSPLPEDGSINDREIKNLEDAALANQIRMNRDPFELMLINMGYRLPVGQPEENNEPNEEIDDQNDQPIVHPLNCRPS
ncbi:PREDICTED: WD and tetratricopeptide repeats protein 1-like [Polistes canadensis]|uniref:WD and tetratricopeptide repeats protein 1-like n=1 Tax=Polistes canadensis TaxID=91411 RepID=UPI000718BE8C|nr:PREDICTED: WD and tetratricopeptide repeats protein 1-like [Polistes canadensis]XP_014614105.1 PREDICTED: WD and tetratricopeptide repeats protein 1-like [Polistes canadensis]XP_014614106.1 PREDICTED: WD and tetratricopeptide repeats protein 1-like [Polistes canadensis]